MDGQQLGVFTYSTSEVLIASNGSNFRRVFQEFSVLFFSVDILLVAGFEAGVVDCVKYLIFVVVFVGCVARDVLVLGFV